MRCVAITAIYRGDSGELVGVVDINRCPFGDLCCVTCQLDNAELYIITYGLVDRTWSVVNHEINIFADIKPGIRKAALLSPPV